MKLRLASQLKYLAHLNAPSESIELKRKLLSQHICRRVGTLAVTTALGVGSIASIVRGAAIDRDDGPAVSQPAAAPAVEIKLMLAPAAKPIIVRHAINAGLAPIPAAALTIVDSDDQRPQSVLAAQSPSELLPVQEGSSADSVVFPLAIVNKDGASEPRRLARAPADVDRSQLVAAPIGPGQQSKSSVDSGEPDTQGSLALESSQVDASIPKAPQSLALELDVSGSENPSAETRPKSAYGGAAPAPIPPGARRLGTRHLGEEQLGGNKPLPSAAEDAKDSRTAEQSPAAKRQTSSKPSAAQPLALQPLDAPKHDGQSIDPENAGKDADEACPGSPESNVEGGGPQPDDIPLSNNDDRPYDAPQAERQIKASQIVPPVRETLSDDQFSATERLMERDINRTLQYFIENPENIVRRGPWALIHATLPFGVETEIVAGRKRVNAIGWMCFNGVCAKQRMFQPTKTGFRPNLGPGVQGHQGQFLAILAQSQVGIDYPIQVGNKRYSVKDLVRYEMATCREKSELTFKLIGLSHYLPGDQVWRDSRRRSWNLEKLVAEELAQPIIGAACGGTHRLMGLSFAVVQRQRDGLPMTGHWVRAEQFLNDYINYAMSLQNPDGSFSTEWFKGRGMDRDVERRVQTTGHILEWLIFSLPDEHLRSEPIQRSVQFLIRSVGNDPSHDWPIGPRGHALRALVLYNQRVFGAEVGKMQEHVAEKLNVRVIR